MRNRITHIFKLKWWLPFIAILPIGLFNICAITYKWEMSINVLGLLEILIGVISTLLMLYVSWQPHQGRPKNWETINEEFRVKQYFKNFMLITGVLIAWLGIGILLILLPYWVGSPLDGFAGGFIQFIGICWIIIGYYSIMHTKKKK